MEESFGYCQDLVRQADKDRFLATLFAPVERRPFLFALYAFNVEIASVPERVSETLAGEVRLQWWRDVLGGTRAAEANANPVASALLAAVAWHDLPAAALIDLIDAHEFDLYDDPMPTVAALESYGRRTASALFTLAARILGAAPTSVIADPAGTAYAITGLLRSFAFHASRRRLYVPVEILERHGAAITDVFAGRTSPQLGAALAALRGIVRGHLDVVMSRQALVSAQTLPAYLPVSMVRGYLARMDRPDYDPFQTTIDVPQWRRQWALWRAARRGAIG
jgi:phytoene synthase